MVRPPENLGRLQAQQQLQRALEEQQQALAARRTQYEQLLRQQPDHQEKAEQVSERLDQLIDSVLTGYRMSLQRLERALQQQGLEPIPGGQPFDPEQMEVVEVVADSGRPSGEVVGEVRRGYLWQAACSALPRCAWRNHSLAASDASAARSATRR